MPHSSIGNPWLPGRGLKVSEAGGYSSPEEFVGHVLEKELAKFDSGASDEEIAKKLQGLGYIDAGLDI